MTTRRDQKHSRNVSILTIQSAKPNIERDSEEDDESNTDFLKAATKVVQKEASKEYLVTGATKSYLIE